MERLQQARAAAAQQEGASSRLGTARPDIRAAEENLQAADVKSLSTPSPFAHHPSRFSIFPRGASGPVPFQAGMERAFAADLSAVRSYRGASSLVTDSGARAAAWPETLVFASPNPSPPVVAHEVAHLLQYRRTAAHPIEGGHAPTDRDAAEQEAHRAAASLESGTPIRLRARPAVEPLFYTDEEEPDSEEFLADRPPQFTGQEVGIWGSSWPASLVARERLPVNVSAAQRSHAIVEAIALREPIVILHEYGRLWLYRLEWEGLSGRYSRFTNSSTLFHAGTNEPGHYSVSNVQGRPEVEAFVTEDGGVLSPPGAGTLFSHTGGEFEDPLVSAFQNASAFLSGMGQGLEGADFAALSAKLRRMSALNTVFPTPFAIGALRGLADEMIELVQLLNPRQWVAMEAAARETILALNDPDGEELAAALGEEFGRNQAATVNALLERSLPIFAYEVGKLVGPTIIELLLALVGIEIGPVAMLQKSLAAMKQVPRVAGLVRDLGRIFPDAPKTPAPSAALRPDEASGQLLVPDASAGPNPLAVREPSPGLPTLSPEEQSLLARTGDPTEFPSGLPKELADQELAIVKRSQKVSISSGDGKYTHEVDLGNGHQWREQPNGTWCRFSDKPTNCTVLIDEPGPQAPGTIVAVASDRKSLMEVYTTWAENRGPDEVEVGIIKAIENSPGYPRGTYAVVTGRPGKGITHPPGLWITVSHTHPGAPGQVGFRHPSGADMGWAQMDALDWLEKETGGVRKWVHSQTPEGAWQSVAYGYDIDRKLFFIQPAGQPPRYFALLHDPNLEQIDFDRYEELEAEGRHQERIELMRQQNAETYYLGWYARQFRFDQ